MADLDVAVRLKFLTAGEEKLKTAARDLAAFGKASNKLSGSATGRLSGNLTKAWTASVKLGGALDKSASAATKAAGALGRIGNEARDIDRTRAAVDRLAKSTRGLDAAQGRSRVGGALAGGALGGAAARRRARFGEGLAEAASRVSPEGYLIGAGGAVMAGAAIGGTAAAIGAGMAYGTKQAISFEKAMADVKKKIDLPVGASWADLEATINRMSREVGMPREQMASLAAAAGQAGIEYNDLAGFMSTAARAASAWDMDAREASLSLARIKAQTQWTIPQIEEFADKVNALGDSSAASERDIVDMFQRSAASAKAANVPLDTSLAVLTAMNSIGMQPEVASRFLNAFSSKLRTAASGGRGAKNAAEGFKELGVSAKEVEKGMKANATKTMIDVLTRLDSSTDKASIAIKLFGQEWWDEAARSGQALPEIIKNLKMIADPKNWKGSLKKNLDVDLATTNKKLEQAKAAVSEIGDGMMRWAMPAINAQLDKLVESVSTLKKTGFLAGPDGKPIDRLEEKNPVPFSPENRARFMPRGIGAYQMRVGLGEPRKAPGAPMFQQIEGATPHINVKQIDAAVADGVAEANSLYDALLKLNMTVTPQVNAGPAISQLDALQAKVNAVNGALRAVGNFGANPGGRLVNPTLTGAPRGGATGGAAPSAPTPGKQTRRSGGGVQIGTAHFHGVKNPAEMHRQLALLQNRQIRRSRDSALHDIG